MVSINNCPDVEIFDGSEGHGNTAYIDRVSEHPEGFVADAYKPEGEDVTTLHKASCKEVSTPDLRNYTQGSHFMAFSLSLQALENCVAQWPGRVENCLQCCNS